MRRLACISKPWRNSPSNPKAVANWVINNLRAKLGETGTALHDVKFKPEAIIELVSLVDSKKISSAIGQQVFGDMFETGEMPSAIVEKKGLAQVSDTGAIEKFCDEVIAANPRPAADYKAGNAAALNFLKGQVMRISKGKANPGSDRRNSRAKAEELTGVPVWNWSCSSVYRAPEIYVLHQEFPRYACAHQSRHATDGNSGKDSHRGVFARETALCSR